ncbi:SIMPL domain-containing protein [Paracoccus sp. PAMC 22219]|uniref:SIMPL domain-containing protein n=1 Tax=Paracoccus sp. PAMC 22219 TaxID=1569209 RepID=UPI000698E76E|nr:SIMPL domain-containing protein [Paracoccus sp. PAMC 22219]
MRPIFRAPPARRLALSVAIAALMAAPALAAPMACGPAGPSRLTVTGEGQSRIAPDMATVQLGVTTQADSAAAAMEQNSTQQTAVIEALTGAGIEEAQIQTSGLNLNPLMQYGENQAPTVTGYQATNTVAVRVSDLARLGEVLDAIVTAGANEINGITFSREDGGDAQDQARRDAVADARRKAELLAEAAGVDLGPVLTLRDIQTGNGGPRPMMRMEAAMADASRSRPERSRWPPRSRSNTRWPERVPARRCRRAAWGCITAVMAALGMVVLMAAPKAVP